MIEELNSKKNELKNFIFKYCIKENEIKNFNKIKEDNKIYYKHQNNSSSKIYIFIYI